MRWLAGFSHPDANARPRQTGRSEGLSRWDGAGVVGYVALAEALDREADAAPAGARLVVVERCFPTGRLGWFAERVARRGLVCLLTATSTARIAHHDGGPPILGTNPICLALPGASEPTVVDVSMGRITYGAVLHAAATGAALPPGAARRPDGAPRPIPPRSSPTGRGSSPSAPSRPTRGLRWRPWSSSCAGRWPAPTDSRPSHCSRNPRPRRSRACASSWASAGFPATTAPGRAPRRCGAGRWRSPTTCGRGCEEGR